MDQSKKSIFNPIGFLNEYCQKNKIPFPVYTIVNREGPAHSPNFNIECVFQNKSFSGSGLSVKEAKEDSAYKAINDFNIKNSIKNVNPSFRIVECSNIESVWDGSSSEIKITFRRKNDNSQQFKTFLFSQAIEIKNNFENV